MSVIVAAGMAGGLALLLAQLSRQQMVIQKKAETGVEMTQLHRRIIAVLYDGDACLKTLGKGGSLHVGRRVGKLLNKGGTPVLEEGAEINRALRVEKMEIQDVVGAGRTKDAQLKVTIKKLGEANKGTGKIVKKFPLTVELDTASRVARCHHTLDSKEHAIKTAMCTEMGGVMVGSPTSFCSITNLFEKNCRDMGARWDATTKKCSLANLLAPLQPKPTTGSCGAGQAMTGVDGDGDAVCVSLSAAQATAPGVPPGCFPVKSELKRMAGGWRSGQEPAVKGSGPACPATYGVTRSILGHCMTLDLRWDHGSHPMKYGSNYTCILSTFCCLN